MSPAERTRKGCLACRERHAKCDETTPACRRCQRLDLECIRSNPIRFAPLKGVPSVASPHKSLGKARELLFVDESSRLANLYSRNRERSPFSTCDSRGAKTEGSSVIENDPDVELDHHGPSLLQSDCDDANEELLAVSRFCTASPSPPLPSWRLENEYEIQLLRHYVDVIATWFDTCDAEKTFGVLVPRLISTFPPLLKAILAVSARHLGILTGRNVLSADKYNQECLSDLIPLLNDDSTMTEDVLLAVIVILRLSEELEAPIVRADSPGHMIGIRQFVRAQGRLAHSSKLRYASLCIMVRQENYLALMNLCPIGWDLKDFTIPRTHSMDDFTWSMFVLRHCSNIIQLCHEGKSHEKEDYWEEMKKTNEVWLTCKPSSFDPVFTSPPNRALGEPFPREWFVQGWHATAMQHYYLNLVLLAISNPYVPRFGVGHVEATRKVEQEILKHMRNLCGIALANSQIQPCLVTAYMSISMCGDRFTDRLEQEKIIELLIQANTRSGWPTVKVQQQLRKAWGWE